MRQYLLQFLLIVAVNIDCLAQAPVISSVQPLSAGPTQKIVITGSGFSATSSQLAVWFDHVKGTIISSTNFSIEVQVPPQAHFSNVEVINLSNYTSAKSKLKFLPSYGGSGFATAKMASAYSNIEKNNELFDVASSDFDMDGKPDLVATKGGPTSIAPITDFYIYQNTSTGIGNIKYVRYDKDSIPAVNVGVPTANVACGDLNGDGKPDIVVAGGGSKRNNVYVLKNTNAVVGTLSFALPITTLLLPSPDPLNPNNNAPLSFEVAIQDFNSDGKPEIVVTNAQDNRLFVFQNTSTGGVLSFNSAPIQVVVTGAVSTYGLEVQDIDGDSMADILVNQFFSNDVFVLRNTSSGNINFAAPVKIPAPGSLTSIASTDLNNDGMLDLMATANGDNTLQIWLNQSTPGNIAFGAGQTHTTDTGPWGVDVSDIEGDGDVDIIVSNKSGSNLNVFTQDSPMIFNRNDLAIPGNFSRNLRVADYDGDGKPDIAYTGTPTSGANYTLNVLRNANCWNPIITSALGASSPVPICAAQKIRLQMKPALGVTYAWTLNGTSTQPGAKDTLQASAAGTYIVTVTGTIDGGCVNPSAGFVLTATTGSAPANPPINNNTPCLGSALNLSTPAVASATYKWTGPSSFSSSTQNPTITPVTNGTGGIYTLQVTVGLCSSNITSKQLDVAFVPVMPVTANPASATVCTAGSVSLTLPSGLTGSYTFQWKNAAGNIGGATLDNYSASVQDTYSVVVTSISTTCGQETAKTNVKIFAKPTVDFSMSAPQCKGDAIVFTSSVTGDARGTLTYAWAFGDGQTSTLKDPPHTYLTANGFAPSVTVGYSEIPGASCTANITHPITVNAPVVPTIQATANPICAGEQSTLSITGSFTTITWVGVTGSSNSVIINAPAKYGVRTTDANGCKSKDSVTIGTKPLFTPFTAKAGRSAIANGDTTKLTATSGADSYLWQPGKTLNDSTIFNPIATPSALPKTYTVTAKKTGFCDATAPVTINPLSEGTALINPPVLFSPNSDGKNDFWKLCYDPLSPTGPCPEESTYADWTMTIFDGHGSQVYQQKGFSQWDGGSAPDGVYYYVFSNTKGKPKTGSVLLVRQKQ